MKTWNFKHVCIEVYCTIKKGRVDEIAFELEFDNKNGRKEEQYTFKAICNSRVYARELDKYLSGLYYLIS